MTLIKLICIMSIMLSQGVEDFKTKEFDFASQVKLP